MWDKHVFLSIKLKWLFNEKYFFTEKSYVYYPYLYSKQSKEAFCNKRIFKYLFSYIDITDTYTHTHTHTHTYIYIYIYIYICVCVCVCMWANSFVTFLNE